MGRKLIIKGADFSANAVSVSPNYEEILVCTSQNLWPNAELIASAYSGFYGFVCPYNGYVTGVIVDAEESYDTNLICVFNQGSTDVLQQAEIGNVSSGKNTYTLSTPVPVTAGQVVTFKGAKFRYSMTSAGDWQTNSNFGTVMQPPYRIYRINFVFQKEVL